MFSLGAQTRDCGGHRCCTPFRRVGFESDLQCLGSRTGRCNMRILSTLLSVVILVVTVGPAPVIADQNSNSSTGDEGSQSSASRLIVPLTGTIAGGGAFSGSFSIAQFEERQGVLYAVGMISGVVIGAPNLA